MHIRNSISQLLAASTIASALAVRSDEALEPRNGHHKIAPKVFLIDMVRNQGLKVTIREAKLLTANQVPS